MRLEVDAETGVVFDLDDTLYKERDFQVSGFRAVLSSIGRSADDELLERMISWDQEGRNTFEELATLLDLTASVSALVDCYRFHPPAISLEPGARELLDELKDRTGGLGLITDGRSATQRAKLRALEIEYLFDVVVVSEEIGSEKPDRRNFDAVRSALPSCTGFILIADNPRKDFVTPNALGWTTVQVDDDGRNVHSQSVQVVDAYRANFHAASLEEIDIVSPRGLSGQDTR